MCVFNVLQFAVGAIGLAITGTMAGPQDLASAAMALSFWCAACRSPSSLLMAAAAVAACAVTAAAACGCLRCHCRCSPSASSVIGGMLQRKAGSFTAATERAPVLAAM